MDHTLYCPGKEAGTKMICLLWLFTRYVGWYAPDLRLMRTEIRVYAYVGIYIYAILVFLVSSIEIFKSTGFAANPHSINLIGIIGIKLKTDILSVVLLL